MGGPEDRMGGTSSYLLSEESIERRSILALCADEGASASGSAELLSSAADAGAVR